MISNMIQRALTILMFLLLVSVAGLAQSPPDDGRGIFPKQEDPSTQPKNVKEMLDKLRIEEEKKTYDEMLDRGGQALKLSEEVEKAYTSNGSLSNDDRAKVDSIEKLVKKIRGGLGGNDTNDEDDLDDIDSPPKSQADAIDKLAKLSERMMDELKKTTRFSISTSAIQSTNAVLRVTRYLRGK